MRCDFENTWDKLQFQFKRVRTKRDEPVHVDQFEMSVISLSPPKPYSTEDKAKIQWFPLNSNACFPANASKVCRFLVAPCCCKPRSYSTCHSAMSSIQFSVCPWQDLQNFFPLSLFCAFLDVSCHPECSKKIHPKSFFTQNFSSMSCG